MNSDVALNYFKFIVIKMNAKNLVRLIIMNKHCIIFLHAFSIMEYLQKYFKVIKCPYFIYFIFILIVMIPFNNLFFSLFLNEKSKSIYL